jgi:hypothetical protein
MALEMMGTKSQIKKRKYGMVVEIHIVVEETRVPNPTTSNKLALPME